MIQKEDALIEPLTGRELEILALLAANRTNHEIAASLSLSVNSVKWYARQIYGKLGIENRRQAAARARELGLLAAVPAAGISPSLPTGTVTFLFTDIEGSTPLWERDAQAMQEAVARHHAILNQTATQYEGHVFKIVGDEFQISFELPAQALQAALTAQRLLQNEPWGSSGPLKVRMGLHTGPASLVNGVLNTADYAVTHTLNRVMRIRSAGSGGQILISAAVMELLRGQLPQDVSLKDMGEHHLKGLLQPERIFQVIAPDLPADFPPLKSVRDPQHNLPQQLSSFIGREKEIAEVKQLLSHTHLLTLSGVGGTGKTRLALMVASQLLEEFEHGVWLVELASLSDPTLIPSTVATMFGVHQEQNRPLQEALNNYFHSKRLLLILDNCEHLIQEAARFAEAVLQAAAEVKILATSRESLGLAGEMIYLVPSLDTPEPPHLPPLLSLAQFDAVRLFTERASAAMPAFTLTEENAPSVAQICHRLDGIPLAIELAAVRVKVLSAEHIAARLDDRFRLLTGGSRTAFPRHQTLHALIDWSYELLSEPERILFRRLSVFRRGWTLEAAEAVCPCGEPAEIEVLDLLAGLVNKSLVSVEMKAGEVQRYYMLETIRQYAQEKLLESGEAAQLRDQHLGYFVIFAEAMEQKLHSLSYLDALEQLDADIDNHRAALDWALGEGGYSSSGGYRTSGGSNASGQNPKLARMDYIRKGLRLAITLADYWNVRGLLLERNGWLSKGLAIPVEEGSLVPLRAKAYQRLGISWGDDSTAQQFGKQSVDLYRTCDDKLGLALSLLFYGLILSDPGPSSPRPVDFSLGIALMEEGIALFEEHGGAQEMGWAFYGRGVIALIHNDYGATRELMEKSIACFEQTGDILSAHMYTILRLVEVAFRQGDYETARRLVGQCLAFYRQVKGKFAIANYTGYLGNIAFCQEDLPQAEAYYQEVLPLYNEMSLSGAIVWATRMLACVAVRQGQVRRARQLFLESQSLGRKLSYGDKTGDPYGDLAIVLWMGSIAESLGQHELAARFLGAVEAILETFFKPLDHPPDKLEYEKIVGKVRSASDKATIAAAWAEGRKLNRDQALEEALAFCRQDTGGEARDG